MGRKAENLVGKKFNHLTVIRRATEEEWPRGSGRHAKWLCKCDCGNYTFVQSSDLKNGGTKSCGCFAKETAAKLAYKLGKSRFDDLTNKQFGRLTVLKKSRQVGKKIYWLCKCQCGVIKEVQAGNLRSGHTRSCGCLKEWNNGNISSGEEKIISLLQKNKISFEREKTFPDLKKHGNNLRYDFYIPSKNAVIEYNGQGHYYLIPYFHKNEQGFKKRQEYDRHKISYCLSHDILIYCIPYWELDNINTIKDLFDNRFIAKNQWKNDIDWQKHKI